MSRHEWYAPLIILSELGARRVSTLVLSVLVVVLVGVGGGAP